MPSRITLACGTCRFESASTLARALSSWREPSTTLSTISSATMTPVETSPMTKLTTVTATSMMFIGIAKLRQGDRPDRRRLLGRDPVRAVLRETRGGLGGRQAGSRVDALSGHDVHGGEGVRRR